MMFLNDSVILAFNEVNIKLLSNREESKSILCDVLPDKFSVLLNVLAIKYALSNVELLKITVS